MPVYEYGCQAGHHFEVKQKFSDAPVTSCQICSLPVTKLISASGISFKGSGWYVTDYSNKMKQGAPEKSASQEKSPSSGAQNDSSTPKGDAKTSTPASPSASGSTSSSDGGSSAGSAPSSPAPSGS